MNGLFITGTDTGVGKTHLTAALLTFLRTRGVDAVPMKPVQTGSRGADDLTTLLAACSMAVSDQERAWMNPYSFPLPASPHLAAAQAGRSISLARIESAYRHLADRHDFVLVEGAGGVGVPLTRTQDTIDLIKRLQVPVLVIARAGLGTLNHTSLACAALAAAHIPLAGILLNLMSKRTPGLIERDNREYLKRAWICPVEFFPAAPFPKAGNKWRLPLPALERIWRRVQRIS